MPLFGANKIFAKGPTHPPRSNKLALGQVAAILTDTSIGAVEERQEIIDTMADDDWSDDDALNTPAADTVDPGPSLLIATAIFCVSLYCFLPTFLSLCDRRKYRRKGHGKKHDDLEGMQIDGSYIIPESAGTNNQEVRTG